MRRETPMARRPAVVPTVHAAADRKPKAVG
jgi:hypothetical protein